jgi:hypothetical protein
MANTFPTQQSELSRYYTEALSNKLFSSTIIDIQTMRTSRGDPNIRGGFVTARVSAIDSLEEELAKTQTCANDESIL